MPATILLMVKAENGKGIGVRNPQDVPHTPRGDGVIIQTTFPTWSPLSTKAPTSSKPSPSRRRTPAPTAIPSTKAPHYHHHHHHQDDQDQNQNKSSTLSPTLTTMIAATSAPSRHHHDDHDDHQQQHTHSPALSQDEGSQDWRDAAGLQDHGSHDAEVDKEEIGEDEDDDASNRGGTIATMVHLTVGLLCCLSFLCISTRKRSELSQQQQRQEKPQRHGPTLCV